MHSLEIRIHAKTPDFEQLFEKSSRIIKDYFKFKRVQQKFSSDSGEDDSKKIFCVESR